MSDWPKCDWRDCNLDADCHTVAKRDIPGDRHEEIEGHFCTAHNDQLSREWRPGSVASNYLRPIVIDPKYLMGGK